MHLITLNNQRHIGNNKPFTLIIYWKLNESNTLLNDPHYTKWCQYLVNVLICNGHYISYNICINTTNVILKLIKFECIMYDNKNSLVNFIRFLHEVFNSMYPRF